MRRATKLKIEVTHHCIVRRGLKMVWALDVIDDALHLSLIVPAVCNITAKTEKAVQSKILQQDSEKLIDAFISMKVDFIILRITHTSRM